MPAPLGGIHHLALVGDPPQHRDHRDPGARALHGGPRYETWHQPVIDPTALLEAFVSVDAGTVRPTRIGARTWLQKNVHVGHDAIVGADCELCVGTVLCGHVEVGDGVRMGVNSSARPFVKIGAGARIGAGAVVICDVPAGETWAGVPAHPINVKAPRQASGYRVMTELKAAQ